MNDSIALFFGWASLVTLGLLTLAAAWIFLIATCEKLIKHWLIPYRTYEAFRLYCSLCSVRRNPSKVVDDGLARRIASQIGLIAEKDRKFAYLLRDVIVETDYIFRAYSN